MAKQSTRIHANVTTVPERLEERLNRHPELKAKIEALLSVVENAEGDLLKANKVEQRVVAEIRQLGQTELQGWAEQQNQAQSEHLSKNNPTSAARTRKKTSTGTVGAEPSKL